jgi:hypothetical protein
MPIVIQFRMCAVDSHVNFSGAAMRSAGVNADPSHFTLPVDALSSVSAVLQEFHI